MYRRNGKLISCEPCRISKVRCDHETPVCARCQARGASEKCFYHPAPMTRKNSGFRPYQVQKQASRPATRKPRAHINSQQKQKLDGDDVVSDPAPSSYLGFFSTLSLCRRLWPVATPRWSIPPDDDFSKFKAVEPPLRRVMASSQHLEAMVRQYRDGMHFIVIPYPLIFDPVLAFLQELRARSAQEACAKLLLKTAKGNLRRRLPPMTADLGLSSFQELFNTSRLRLEFLSLVFSLCGLTSLYADVGDAFDSTAFATEMYNASKHCLQICRSHNQLNDITVWSSFINTIFLSSLFGNASDMAYHWFNEFVSELFILGFHRLVSSPPDIPFFVLETRKRIFAMAVAQDKSISTLLGRPPRIDSRFCDLTVPFDLDDSEVVLDGSRLETVLQELGDGGWKCDSETNQALRPSVLIRLRYRHALLQERVLGLWMTERQESFSNTLHDVYEEYELGKTRIPPQYQYSGDIWNKASPWLCVALLVADLSYLYSGFLLDRMLLQSSQISPTRLLDKSAKLLSGALEFIQRQSSHPELGGRFPWLFLYYGLPGAGTLAAELHQSTLNRVPIQTSVPVSKVVRDLSILLSYFERERLPDRPDFQVCTHIGKMIGALLDDTLNRGLPPSAESTQLPNPQPAQERPDLTGTIPHEGFDSLNLATDSMASQAFLNWFDELIWDYPTLDLDSDVLLEPQ